MKALVLIADGSEEMEIVITVDVLRRAQWDVTTASVDDTTITASRGVRLLADQSLESVDAGAYDILVIPGGMGGVERLMSEEAVLDTVRHFQGNARWIGAICAGPLVLQAAGILEGKLVTSHPSVREQLTVPRTSDNRVVVDGLLVTSQGPGTAFEFALKMIELLESTEAAQAVAAGLVLP